ncbi:MAG: hypothetical protein IIW08_01565 [Clostridia bacterium]|nr:hypothetical protein [Clostridia bacterium]MBQ2433727.1 hypothetical protein [Clostridia bacterium]MBQ5769845.1 hypothetical protein [Clostridia bacterium]
MKKLSLFLVLVFIALSISACTGTPVIYTTNCNCPGTCVVDGNTSSQTENTPAAAEGDLKTGLAIVANAGKSKSASAEENGAAEYDVSVVAVTVDANGRIASCIIDSIGASFSFDAAGQLVTDMSTPVLTKNELKEDYKMKLYGSKYEWYEQADALAKYAVGKTIDEFKNGAVNESGKAKDADLASVASIYIGGYVNAVEKAAANAQNLGAKAGDELRLSISPAFASCAAATAEKAGNAELDVDACALTVNGGVITSCFIDSVQAKVAFDAQGQINKAIEGDVLTKNELKEGYNMKTWGQAKYEWYEQAASFCKYVTGKTFDQVKNIAIDAGTKPTEADLASTVTIAIGGFQGLIAKAAN